MQILGINTKLISSKDVDFDSTRYEFEVQIIVNGNKWKFGKRFFSFGWDQQEAEDKVIEDIINGKDFFFIQDIELN